jgi:hypothetical protein
LDGAGRIITTKPGDAQNIVLRDRFLVGEGLARSGFPTSSLLQISTSGHLKTAIEETELSLRAPENLSERGVARLATIFGILMTIQHDTVSPASVLAKYVGIALVLLVLIWGVSRLVIRPANDLLHRADNAFARVFNLAPQTTIKGDSVVLEKSSIAELAVVARKTSTLIKHESTWLGSTKTLIVRGDFIAKAGFDLNQAFRMQIDQASGHVTVDLPRPKVLSVELKHHEILFSSPGIINKLGPEDHEAVMRVMYAKAREDVERSDLTEEAIQQVSIRLHDLLDSTARKITIRHDSIEVPHFRQLQ